MIFKEYDVVQVVLFKDDRCLDEFKGTIVSIYNDNNFCVENSTTNECRDITINDNYKITLIWRSKE